MLITLKITGFSPLLMNNPTKMVRGGSGMAVKKIPTPEDEAESGAYRLPDKQLYVPARAFRSSMLDAVKGRKIGKIAAARVFGSAMFETDACENCPLIDPQSSTPLVDYAIDVRRAVVQGNGVMRARARVAPWQCDVTFEYDPDFLSPENILEAANLAGRTVGVLDYRPRPPKGKGGPFGRFTAELRGGVA